MAPWAQPRCSVPRLEPPADGQLDDLVRIGSAHEERLAFARRPRPQRHLEKGALARCPRAVEVDALVGDVELADWEGAEGVGHPRRHLGYASTNSAGTGVINRRVVAEERAVVIPVPAVQGDGVVAQQPLDGIDLAKIVRRGLRSRGHCRPFNLSSVSARPTDRGQTTAGTTRLTDGADQMSAGADVELTSRTSLPTTVLSARSWRARGS